MSDFIKMMKKQRASATCTKVYWKIMKDEMDKLVPFLPHCQNLLDIGCGLGGMDVMLYRHYLGTIDLFLLDKTPDKERSPWISPNERLAQHIMSAYLSGLTSFEHENKLIDLFFDHALDKIRANSIFWLSKVLGSERPSAEDEIWMKLWFLWQTRINDIRVQEDPGNYSQEISEYMRWLEFVPVDMGVLYTTIEHSIVYLQKGYEGRLLVAYAAKNCEQYPLDSVSLLFRIIKWSKEPWLVPDKKDEESILRTVLDSEHSQAKRIAIEVINYRGENGDFRWKDLI